MTSADLINRVILTHIRIPFKEPFRISGLEVPVRDAILVEVESGSGIGLGEGTQWPGSPARGRIPWRRPGRTWRSGSRRCPATGSPPSRTLQRSPKAGRQLVRRRRR